MGRKGPVRPVADDDYDQRSRKDKGLPLPIGDSSPIHIVRTDFNLNAVPRDNPDPEFTHLSRQTAKNDMVHVVQFHAERPADLLGDNAGQLDRLFFLFLFATQNELLVSNRLDLKIS